MLIGKLFTKLNVIFFFFAGKPQNVLLATLYRICCRAFVQANVGFPLNENLPNKPGLDISLTQSSSTPLSLNPLRLINFLT